MNLSRVQSVVMNPRRTIEMEVWECRHCRAIKPVNGEKPERCWNYKCRRADWDRDKIKIGRPRSDAKKTKPKQPGRPKERGKKPRGAKK